MHHLNAATGWEEERVTSNHQVGAGFYVTFREGNKKLSRYCIKRIIWVGWMFFLTVLLDFVPWTDWMGWECERWMNSLLWIWFFAKDGRAQPLNPPRLRPSTLGTEERVFGSWRLFRSKAVSSFLKILRTWDEDAWRVLQARFYVQVHLVGRNNVDVAHAVVARLKVGLAAGCGVACA